jgi:5'-nucleotidase/UDP-sugar diphosphatase
MLTNTTNISKIISLMILSVLLTACSLSSELTVKKHNTHTSSVKNSQTQKFTILHTNDNHGRFWHNDKGEYGMAARKTLIDKLRAEAKIKGSEVLLLSGGDINTGIPESDLQYAEPDFKGMSLIGYDAMAIGNHEFDNPVSVLEKQQTWANFPFLSANIYDKKSNTHAYQPYKIFHKANLKIAVIGLTTIDTAVIGNPEYIGHLDFKDPTAITKSLIDNLNKTVQPDVIIALTHMGHYSNAQHGVNAPGDVTLARHLPTNLLDMIIGGHSQKPVCMLANNIADVNYTPGSTCVPEQQNGTWIMQAHEWGKYVGRAEFELKNNKLHLLNYQLIPVNLTKNIADQQNKITSRFIEEEIIKDEALFEFLKPFQDKGSAQISGTVGYLNGKLEGDRNKVRFQQTNLGRLIASIQMQKMDADFGVISGGGIRHSIEEGEVTYKDILTVLPFRNRVAYVDMSGHEIEEYLSTIALFSKDSGAYAQFFGVSLTIFNNNISNIKINGEVLNRNKTYRFSVNSYNASGGDGYPMLKNHPKYVETHFTDVEILKEYFLKHSPVDANMFNQDNQIIYQ